MLSRFETALFQATVVCGLLAIATLLNALTTPTLQTPVRMVASIQAVK